MTPPPPPPPPPPPSHLHSLNSAKNLDHHQVVWLRVTSAKSFSCHNRLSIVDGHVTRWWPVGIIEKGEGERVLILLFRDPRMPAPLGSTAQPHTLLTVLSPLCSIAQRTRTETFQQAETIWESYLLPLTVWLAWGDASRTGSGKSANNSLTVNDGSGSEKLPDSRIGIEIKQWIKTQVHYLRLRCIRQYGCHMKRTKSSQSLSLSLTHSLFHSLSFSAYHSRS